MCHFLRVGLVHNLLSLVELIFPHFRICFEAIEMRFQVVSLKLHDSELLLEGTEVIFARGKEDFHFLEPAEEFCDQCFWTFFVLDEQKIDFAHHGLPLIE